MAYEIRGLNRRPSLNRSLDKLFLKLFQRLRAMAQLIFHVVTEFRKRLVENVRHEQWVIAETILAARREDDFPFARAVESLCGRFLRKADRRGVFNLFVRHRDEGDYTAEPCRA